MVLDCATHALNGSSNKPCATVGLRMVRNLPYKACKRRSSSKSSVCSILLLAPLETQPPLAYHRRGSSSTGKHRPRHSVSNIRVIIDEMRTLCV